MKQNRMYDEFAHLWPLLSAPEEYAAGARQWRAAIRAHLGAGRGRLLDLGTGGGHHLSHFTPHFAAVAVDMAPRMLAVSERVNPDVPHYVGDMRTVRLNRQFDVVMVHDAINYMATENDLRALFLTAAAHLRPGGLFITAPDWFRETFPGRDVTRFTRAQDGLEVTYTGDERALDTDEPGKELYVTFAIREGGRVRVEHDRHVMGLFPRRRWTALLAEAGFHVRMQPCALHCDGRDEAFLLGVRPVRMPVVRVFMPHRARGKAAASETAPAR